MSDTQDTGVETPVTGTEGSELAEQMLETAAEGTEQAQEQAVEAEKQPEAPKEDKFAAKFAALTRKEREIKQKEARLAKQMQELEAKLQSFESERTEAAKYKSIPEKLRQQPLEVLKEAGLSFEQLAQMVLENDGKPTQDMKMSEMEQKYMTKLQELEKKMQEKEEAEKTARETAALENFKAELTGFIEQTPDYELIRANGAQDAVFAVIEQHYAETGEILSNKDASDAVEEYLLEEAKKLVDREKVKKLLQPEQPKVQPKQGKPSPTLSNAQAAQATKSAAAKKMSHEESMAEAAKLIKWIED